MAIDNSVRDKLTAAKANRDAARGAGSVGGGGSGPYDSDMDARIKSLEADTHAMRITLERIDERTSHLATSADIAACNGVIGTMSERVVALGNRVDKVEKAIDEAIRVALSKTIPCGNCQPFWSHASF